MTNPWFCGDCGFQAEGAEFIFEDVNDEGQIVNRPNCPECNSENVGIVRASSRVYGPFVILNETIAPSSRRRGKASD